MCILFFAYRVYQQTPFLLLDNRDEDYPRPTRSLHQWEDLPQIIGSRDLQRKGTWMAVNQTRHRFAVLTNLRIPHDQVHLEEGKKSRGKAVLELLLGENDVEEALHTLSSHREEFGRFNLLIGDLDGWSEGKERIYYFANYLPVEQAVTRLQPGQVYGLSNASLSTPWPKVLLGIRLVSGLGEDGAADMEQVMGVLTNEEKVPHDKIEPTGLQTMEEEYQLSSIFVCYPERGYGTRTSSVLRISSPSEGTAPVLEYYERTYEPADVAHYQDLTRTVPL